MFIKAFKVKSNVQVKATDKKKIRQRISHQFPNLSEDCLNKIASTKDSFMNIKIITHSGDLVTIYSIEKKPMFFEIDETNKLYPTVYAMWLVPDLCALFTTHSNVFPKLANGADLMLPGVVRQDGTDLRSWGRHEKGDIVAVNLTSNKSAVAVGHLNRSSEDMYMSAGTGVCVNVIHVFGDKLWSIEPTVCIQIPHLEAVISVPKSTDFPSLSDSMKKKADNKNDVVEEINDISNEIQDLTINEEIIKEVASPDKILKDAFLTALKLDGKKLVLPLLTSNFYRLHVLPATNQENFDLKSTSFKKLSKFLKQMAEEGFIKVKEETKGVEKISEVNLAHPDIRTLKVNFPVKADAPVVEKTQLFTTTVTELYLITEDTEELFNIFNLPKGTSLDKTQIANYVKDYIGRNKLLVPITKKITLDPILSEICCSTDELELKEVQSRVIQNMELSYEMRSQTATKGKLPSIQLTLATRSGNKKVTLISNLEAYGIIVPEFAKACKLGVAASTSITRTPGSKTDQLLVQGNQIKFISNLLTQTYKIAPKNIIGMELAKKEKKSKNTVKK